MDWNQWSDEWRAQYRGKPYAWHQEQTRAILAAHPNQEGFDYEFFRQCIDAIPDAKISVMEFGGWRGGLAMQAIAGDSRIERWLNIEVTDIARENAECDSPRYSCYVPSDFVWNTPQLADHTVFVSSHAIEHITREHLHALLDWIPAGVQYLWLQAPLPEDETNNTWPYYGGTHILEDGWKQVIEFLQPTHTLIGRGGIRNECLFFARNVTQALIG